MLIYKVVLVEAQKLYFWTTNGDGVFSSQIINNPSYSPGPNDITNGSVMIYLTSNAPSAFCPAAVDSLLITISPPRQLTQ